MIYKLVCCIFLLRLKIVNWALRLRKNSLIKKFGNVGELEHFILIFF